MEELDADELLKDADDKSHDDIWKVIEEWRKSDKCLEPTPLLQQQQNEEPYKVDLSMFTRPKSQCPMTKSEIFERLKAMRIAYLEGTSPPTTFNNFPIKSCDFSDSSSPQSTQSLKIEDHDIFAFNFSDKATFDGNTQSKEIRDCKTLESQTISCEDVLIKNSQNSRIDDIKLMLSKIASTNNTLTNQTDIINNNNQTTQIVNKDDTINNAEAGNNTNENMFCRTMLVGNDNFNVSNFKLENSLHNEELVEQNSDFNVDNELQPNIETFIKPTTINETMCVIEDLNTTLKYQQSFSESLNQTPVNVKMSTRVATNNIYESTPQILNVFHNRSTISTPTPQEMVKNFNMSPTIASHVQRTAPLALNETFEVKPPATETKSNTFSDILHNRSTISTPTPQAMVKYFNISPIIATHVQRTAPLALNETFEVKPPATETKTNTFSDIRHNRSTISTPTPQAMLKYFNISPIIATHVQRSAPLVLDETFEVKPPATETKTNALSDTLLPLKGMNIKDNIQNSNATYMKFKSVAGNEMQNIRLLAKAEAELLSGCKTESETEIQNNSLRFSQLPFIDRSEQKVEEPFKTDLPKVNSKYIEPNETNSITEVQNASSNVVKSAKSRLGPQVRLPVPCNNSLQKFRVVSKVASTGDLNNTTAISTVITGASVSQKANNSFSIRNPTHSKEFRKLFNNSEYKTTGNGTPTLNTTFGLKENNNTTVVTENLVKTNCTKPSRLRPPTTFNRIGLPEHSSLT